MKIDVTYDGTAYPFDFSDISLPESFTVKSVAHLNLGQFQTEVFDSNPFAVLALVVLALRRAGQVVVAKDIDQEKVDIHALAQSLSDGIDAARAALTATTGSGASSAE